MADDSCKSCGRPVIIGHETRCAWCNAPLVKEPEPDTPVDSKQNRIIKAKIATKEVEMSDISQAGPVLVVIIGILCCLTIFGIIIGIPLILFGIWWSGARDTRRRKLNNEIVELQEELE